MPGCQAWVHGWCLDATPALSSPFLADHKPALSTVAAVAVAVTSRRGLGQINHSFGTTRVLVLGMGVRGGSRHRPSGHGEHPWVPRYHREGHPATP